MGPVALAQVWQAAAKSGTSSRSFGVFPRSCHPDDLFWPSGPAICYLDDFSIACWDASGQGQGEAHRGQPTGRRTSTIDGGP